MDFIDAKKRAKEEQRQKVIFLSETNKNIVHRAQIFKFIRWHLALFEKFLSVFF